MENGCFFADYHEGIRQELDTFITTHKILIEDERADEDAHSLEVMAALAEAKLLNLVVDGAYGGRFDKLDVRALCLARERLAYGSALADLMFAMQGLGSYAISLAGSEATKQHYLPGVATGKLVAAFALTEPEAGSDTSGMQTTAVADGDSYIINGQKCFISNVGIAHFYTVFAKTDMSAGNRGISAFVVDADNPGFSVTKRLRMTSPHPIGEISFTDCRVSATKMLGAPNTGFKLAMRALDTFRSSVGAMALGLGSRALDEALNYARTRIQFKRPLSDFQAIQFKLADMALDLDAARLLVYRAAWLKDQGAERITKEAAMAKLFATEAAQRAIDEAIQIHGGRGLIHGAITERLYRDIRSTRIYEGTSEIQRLVIAGQLLAQK